MILHFTFIRKKQMTKKQTDIHDFFNEIPGHIWTVISHIISICIFKIPELRMQLCNSEPLRKCWSLFSIFSLRRMGIWVLR